MSEADLTPVSVEQDGRILTGVGVTKEALEETMERHAPPEPDTQAPAAVPVPGAEPPQTDRRTRGAKRFDQLTGEREAQRRRAEDAERERDELKARLSAAPPPAAEPRPEPAAAAQAAKPAVKEPTLDDFASEADPYSAYVRALARYDRQQDQSQLDLDARIRQSIEADRAARTQADHLEQSRTRARSVYPDFDAVLNAPHVVSSNWPLQKLQAIAALAEPEHVQYALAKDPALAERLRTEADPVAFGMALARLIPAESVAPPASTGLRSAAVAPPPYQPVGSGSKTTVLPSADLIKKGGFDFDKSGYRERRAAERGVTHR